MARPIAFDRKLVFDQAIREFSLHGYTATSIKNLVDATGLQPGSIYSAFGDKRGLFIACLDAYFDTLKHSMENALSGKEPAKRRLENFFSRIVEESVKDPSRKGCLLVNTLSEIPIEDEEINTRLKTMFFELEQDLVKVLKECQLNGQLDPKKDPGSLAKYLITCIMGLRLFNKTRSEPEVLKQIVDYMLSVIDISS